MIIAENKNNIPVTFRGVEKQKLEMLFITNSERRKGLGKRLLNYDIENYSINELTVNEQNTNARCFYKYMGFKIYKRTNTDEQGNPYPVLYIKYKKCLF